MRTVEPNGWTWNMHRMIWWWQWLWRWWVDDDEGDKENELSVWIFVQRAIVCVFWNKYTCHISKKKFFLANKTPRAHYLLCNSWPRVWRRVRSTSCKLSFLKIKLFESVLPRFQSILFSIFLFLAALWCHNRHFNHIPHIYLILTIFADIFDIK